MAAISIFGLGYVGAVSAACLASDGHKVIGVDRATVKVDLINAGKSPIIEAEVDELTAAGVRNGLLRATESAEDAVRNTDISIVCVGTPSASNGNLDTTAIEAVCNEIGSALASKGSWHTVVIRSTILPGTMHNVVRPALEKSSGLKCGTDFGLANNPEFLREGTAVKDYRNPPKTVIGAFDTRSAEAVSALYANLPAPLIVTDIEVGEMVKYVDNVWHAFKVAFGNEIGNLCKALGIDSHKVMDIFVQDTKLNISPYYLKPGFAFGGSCLPKDVRAFNYLAKRQDVELPLLSNVLTSNRQQVDRAEQMILDTGARSIGILGFSFKAGTDDLRESPIVSLIERLIGKGKQLRIFDRNVQLAKLVGANRDYLLTVIPHISNLMTDDLQALIDEVDLIVIGNGDAAFNDIYAKRRDGQSILDLVRIADAPIGQEGYQGVNW